MRARRAACSPAGSRCASACTAPPSSAARCAPAPASTSPPPGTPSARGCLHSASSLPGTASPGSAGSPPRCSARRPAATRASAGVRCSTTARAASAARQRWPRPLPTSSSRCRRRASPGAMSSSRQRVVVPLLVHPRVVAPGQIDRHVARKLVVEADLVLVEPQPQADLLAGRMGRRELQHERLRPGARLVLHPHAARQAVHPRALADALGGERGHAHVEPALARAAVSHSGVTSSMPLGTGTVANVSLPKRPGYDPGPRSIEYGCQRRRSVFSSTDGFTHDFGHRPVSTSAISVPTRRRDSGAIRADADATCGVRMTLSMCSSGFSGSGGSFSSTSSPRPRSTPPAAPG